MPDADALLEHAGFLRALARGLLRDEHQANDVVQETFLAALESPPRVLGRAWLGAVARRLSLARRRADGRRGRRERAAAQPEALPAAVDVAARIEVQRRVVEAVDALPEPFRTAVVLRYFDGLGADEIAHRTGTTPATVRSRLHRARERLHERLDATHPGGRRAWSLALLPLAVARTGRRGLLAGATLMSKKTLAVRSGPTRCAGSSW